MPKVGSQEASLVINALSPLYVSKLLHKNHLYHNQLYPQEKLLKYENKKVINTTIQAY